MFEEFEDAVKSSITVQRINFQRSYVDGTYMSPTTNLMFQAYMLGRGVDIANPPPSKTPKLTLVKG